MVFPLASAVVTGAEKTTVRTPEVPVPFRTSAFFVYVFGGTALSAHVTSFATGVGPASIANVTMIVFPAATPAPGTVTAIVVPAARLLLIPMFFTSAGAASARVAPSASTTAAMSGAIRRFRSAFTVVPPAAEAVSPPPAGRARLVPQRKR